MYCDNDVIDSKLLYIEGQIENSIELQNLFMHYLEAFTLLLNRNQKYGDSWKVLKVPSLANLCEMKLNRISNLKQLDPKTEDEFQDVLNYMAFGLYKLKNITK